MNAPKDLFSQVNNTLVFIQKSKSNADLKLNQDISRSESNKDIPISDSKKDRIESVKVKITHSFCKLRNNFGNLNKNLLQDHEEKEMNKNLSNKMPENTKHPDGETKKTVKEIKELESNMPVQSPIEQRRQAEREKMERLKMSKKLDEVFGVIRSESVDEMRTEIKVRGMGDINLKRQVVKKPKVEHNKIDEYAE